MSIGTELKEAREKAGLSIEEVAERTKIPQHKIDALETSSFDALPNGIYLDGIVRAYAVEVGVEPGPLVERVRAERTLLSDAWIVSALSGDLNAFEEEKAADDIVLQRTVVTEPSESPTARSASAVRSDSAVLFPSSDSAVLFPPRPLTQPLRRPIGFAVPVLALLAVAGWGAFLYQRIHQANFNASADNSIAAPKPASSTKSDPTEGAARPGRLTQDQNITSNDRTATAGPEPRAPARAKVDARSVPRTGSVQTPSAAAAPPTKAATARTSVHDVSGSWRLVTHVESSSYSPFAGMILGYEIQIKQAGDEVKGEGRKITENGAEVASHAQTPISLAGAIAGDRLTLAFTEQGAQRSTQGKFVLLIDDGETLRGRFSSSAARSSGTVEAHRLSR